MNIKNLFQGFVFILLGVALLFPSCLGGNDAESEYSSDAQIYSFSAEADDTYDTLSILSKATFAIDQLTSPPKIYSKDSLAYGFVAKNALLTINTNSAGGVVLYYADKDSSFLYSSSDSVNLSRLTKLTVYANDGVTSREYNFKINTHQEDPDVLAWKNIGSNYIQPSSASSQKTIFLNQKFVTYYLSGNAVKAITSSDGKTWAGITVSGLPVNVRLSSLLSVTDNPAQWAYAVASDNSVYKSSDGASWSNTGASYPVEAIYRKLPSATVDSLLIAVKDGGAIKFAKTKDFSHIRLLRAIPEGFPVRDFSALSMPNSKSYTMRYIVLAGGSDAGGIQRNNAWVVQEKDNVVNALARTQGSLDLQGCTLFAYDGQKQYDGKEIYVLAGSEGKNTLSYSGDYGLTWNVAPQKQLLPDGFPYRKSASVITDDENYIWIFGGAAGISQVVDVWRGRLNRLAVQ